MALQTVFIDCTSARSPEISQTQLLWSVVEPLLEQQGCQCHYMRYLDGAESNTDYAGTSSNDRLLAAIADAAIVLVGTPVTRGSISAACVTAIDRLTAACAGYGTDALGASPFAGKVTGWLATCDEFGLGSSIPGLCFQLGQLGFTHPPNNGVAWSRSEPTENFAESRGHCSYVVNRDARLMVANVVEHAKVLGSHSATIDRSGILKAAKAIATAENTLTSSKFAIRPIQTSASSIGVPKEGVPKKCIEMRTWVVMQEGMRRGFEFAVMNLSERLFRAEKDSQGFMFEVYPSHLAFRMGCRSYSREKSKVYKLQRMAACGLPVPTSYGVFQRAADIPYSQIAYPAVAKPDAGSISENVFPNVQSQADLQQAALAIEQSGKPIALESFVRGQDYRITIVNGTYVGCAQRRPASVLGDGQHSILELFHQRNQEANRGDRYDVHTTIHKLVWDTVTWRLLAEKGYQASTVLPAEERFYLQTKITAALGADYVDVSDDLHSSTIEMCLKFAQEFDTLTLGFDVISSDISQPLQDVLGAFNEYNFLPYLDLHERCNHGQQRQVTTHIWDYIEEHSSEVMSTAFQAF